jgi:hypothetical protein
MHHAQLILKRFTTTLNVLFAIIIVHISFSTDEDSYCKLNCEIKYGRGVSSIVNVLIIALRRLLNMKRIFVNEKAIAEEK